MRARAHEVAAAALLALALELGALGQTRKDCGPAIAGCGPAAVGSGATTTTLPPLMVPGAGVADANCPGPSFPTQTGTTPRPNRIETTLTCPTPARTTSVLSISFWA